MGGQSYLQRMVVGMEAKETGLERHLGGDNAAGEATPFKPESSREDDEEEDEGKTSPFSAA
jgi:hypothetical protein